MPPYSTACTRNGLRVRLNVILVNMLGVRFSDETAAGYPYDNYGTIKDQ